MAPAPESGAAEKVMAGRSVVDQEEGRETGEGEVSKLCERTTRTLPEKALFARGMAALWRARARSVFA